MDLVSLFDSSVRKYPTKDFLRFQGRGLSYSAVQADTWRAAGALRQLGVGRGDRVALMCLNTPGFVAALFGAWRLGASVVPVNHKLQAPELRYILDHSQAKLCIGDGALGAVLRQVQESAPCLTTDSPVEGLGDFDALCAATDAGALADAPPPETAIAEVLYTSGTTGRPKGCLHNHRNVMQTAVTAALALSITRNERTLLAMPIWHSSPLNNWFLGTLYMGGTVVLLREYHPLHFLQTVVDERITLYFGAPVSYLAPLKMVPNFADYDLSGVRAWVYGGGPIGAEQARLLAKMYRSEAFYQVYGMTETGPVGTTLFPEEQVAKAGSIGRVALPGVDVRVVDGAGRDVAPGQVGEIWMRADSVMQGYLNDEAATREAVTADGWYRSGDLARCDQDGYLFIVDRTKDMIVTGGENVYSKEVEDVLGAHPDIADAAVLGRPHAEWGETVVAHIVPKAGSTLTPEAITAYLADKLAKYKIPREYVFAESLPRTPTGKLQKFLLRKTP
jgi:feruloyl-CoA synthase